MNTSPAIVMKGVLPYWGVSVLGLSIIFVFFKDVSGIYSTWLGSGISLIGLYQLANNQHRILVQNKRSLALVGLLFRLVLYSVPIIISLQFSNYFKFWVILLCLFKSQVIFILRELILNYISYKQRMKNHG